MPPASSDHAANAPQQLAELQAAQAGLAEAASSASARADGLATEAAEVAGLKAELQEAQAARETAAAQLAEAQVSDFFSLVGGPCLKLARAVVLQAAQEEMESTDAQRKARFAKMQTKYDAQLCASQHPIWLTQLRASD